MNKTFVVVCLSFGIILCGFVNMQQDRKIQSLTDRIQKLEQSK